MKSTLLLSFGLLASMLNCQAQSVTLTVSEHPVCTVKNQPVVIRTHALKQFAEQEYEHIAVFHNGRELSSQHDDLNADGIIDEIAFLIDIEQNQPCQVELRLVEQHPIFQREVNAQMWVKGAVGGEFKQHTAEGKTYGIKPVTQQTFYPGDDSFHKMHHHGVAFESDTMAYRIYFDKRQTIDVYAKKMPRLELEQCLWYPDDTQLANGFGDDVLKVGNTIGVGSVRPLNGSKLGNIDKFAERTQRIVAQGNIRTICETEVIGWQTEGKTTDMTVRYTLYAHHRDVLCEIFLSSPIEHLVTGVQRVGNGNIYKDSTLLGSWGTDWPVNDTIKYAKETIGLGVYVPKEYIQSHVEDSRNNLFVLQPTKYIFFYLTVVAQKEANPPAHTEEEFWEYLRTYRNTTANILTLPDSLHEKRR